MARIAFLLLCHKDPAAVVEQAERLAAAGDRVAIHFDARAPARDWRRIKAALAGNGGVAFARRRVRCGWGEWSLLEATLEALRAAVDAFGDATHFFMLSGDCVAIKSAAYAHALLDGADADFIESFPLASDWVKTGLREERVRFRHWFNERRSKRLFYASLEVQRRLRLEREPPADIEVMIGSQWWCLRRRTVEAMLRFIEARPDVVRFFRTTWIPDETFFQTLARHLVPEREIRSRTLTFLVFTDYGVPVTFHDDHHDLLLAQDHLFARKVSPEARELKARLGRLWASGRTDFRVGGDGRRLYRFLAGRGRVGRRHAPRFWEAAGSLGRERELLVVACKKWHVAKRLARLAGRQAGIPALGYLFDEEDAGLPDLGGLERGLDKRGRHRRALLRVLFDAHGADRLLLCLDPGAFDLMADLFADPATTRLLEVECRLDDAFLAGHARRAGLAGEDAGPEAVADLLPALRLDLRHEADRLRDARFPNHERIGEDRSLEENAAALARFLRASPEVARGLAETPYLFAD